MSAHIEDIYPLSPLQQGFLFHSLYSPESGAYFEQFTCTLQGALDPEAFERAWQKVIDRHSALRSVFLWEDLDAPLQVVHRHVNLPLTFYDWRNLSPSEQHIQLEAYFQTERQRGFDLSQAPLLRATLIQMADTRYQFVWCNHHLLMDGWSMALLIKEGFAFYTAFAKGQDFRLPPSRPYRDYIAWLQKQDQAKAEAFWRTTLSSFHAPTPLVVGRPNHVVDGPEQHTEQRIVLSQAATEALHTIARQHKLTMNTLVQGAWALLLSRYSGETDIVFGSPISSRPAQLPGSNGMVGLFINTIPVRVKVPRQAAIATWLQELQQQQVEAQQYHYTALAQIQSWSAIPRGMPLFESILVFENYPLAAWKQQGGETLALSDVRFIEQTNYPLSIEAVLVPELVIQMLYDNRRFDPTTITRMLDHFQILLHGFATLPHGRLSELSLLTEAERHMLLEEWNTTDSLFPAEQSLHQMVEHHARCTPAAVAVAVAGQQLTYQELNGRANQLARHLQSRGVGPNTLAGICVEASFDLVIGILGILKTGAAYVPLDPRYPAERLRYMLEDSQAVVLLTQQALAIQLPIRPEAVVYLDSEWTAISRHSREDLAASVDPQSLAYVIYTSGSTGQPKGVACAHRSVVNLLSDIDRRQPLPAGSQASLWTSMSFDVSVYELLSALTSGATLHIVPDEVRTDGPRLCAWLAERRIASAYLPPFMVADLATAVAHNPAAFSLRRLLVGVEPIPEALLQGIGHRLPELVIINGYGPTETTVCSTIYHVTDGPDRDRPAPIGRPIQNTRIYLLDYQLQLTPIGVAGEVYIGGEGLARGYLNRPELTAERFIPDPFSHPEGAHAGSRLYRVGDLARWLPDGTLEFLGRADHQVKIRGFRIETAEIEAVLSAHPAVQDCVVIAREDTPGQKRLVAYVVAEAGSAPTTQELRAALQISLPEHMVPAVFVMLESLPLTPNGKINRQALPTPDQVRAGADEAYVAPQTPAEQILAAIWSEILGIEPIGIHDNFFELGGDSIVCIQIISRANQAGLQLTPKQLFEQRTIANLAAVAGTGPTIKAEQGLVSGPVPLTPVQRWFFAQDLPAPQHWNQSALLEVRQPLDPTLLTQVLHQLEIHHDALRLRFLETAAGWEQINTEHAAPPAVTCIDLATLAEAQQTVALETAASELQASLDLATGPLIRVALFNLGASRPGRLLVVVHHLAFDGISWRIFFEDLATAYQQLAQGQPIKLPAKTSAYKYWAERLVEYRQSAALQQEAAYWLAQSGAAATLPVDFPAGLDSNTEASASTVTVTLDVAETALLLQEVPKAYHTQINDALLTALARCLTRWSGQPDVLVDLESHGREDIFDDVDVSRTIGWFTAIAPLQLSLAGSDDIGQALQSIKEQLRQVPQRGIGYGILRYLGDQDQTGPLEALATPQIGFNYLGQFGYGLSAESPLGWAPESTGPDHSPAGLRPHLLEVGGSVINDQLRIQWIYSANIHRQATIEQLAQAFIEELRGLIAHCQLPDVGGYTPSDFPLARLQPQDLAGLSKVYRQIDDLYPLTPTQEGMLFHSLYEPESTVYFMQISWLFEGNLDPAAFRAAWQHTINRHSILRTAFVWEGLSKALQLVHPAVELPWEQLDWRELAPERQQSALDAYLEADKKRVFDLARPPLMRVAIIRLADSAYHFVWSQHHILLDGWCTNIILKEVFTCYEAFVQGQAVPTQRLAAIRPYRDYVAWLQQQDLSRSEPYWREVLKGFSQATPLPTATGAQQGGVDYDLQKIRLSASTTTNLQALVRQHQITLNTLLQGLWACVLAHHSGRQDIVFGSTVSGRPVELSGADAMLGLFINTLPVRIQLQPEALALEWLKGIQAQQVEMRQYEYTPLTQVQRWSELPPRQPLFESVVVFENLPMDGNDQSQFKDLSITSVKSFIQNNFPLTIRGAPGAEFELHVLYDRQRFATLTAVQLLRQLELLLCTLERQPALRLADLGALLVEFDQQHQRQQEQMSETTSLQKLKQVKRRAIRGQQSDL